MKKQTLPLFFTLLLSLLFLSACVPDLKINFKKEPTTTSSKKKNTKKVARVVLATRVAQLAQVIPLALHQLPRRPLLTPSQQKDSLEMLKKLQKIRFMRQGT